MGMVKIIYLLRNLVYRLMILVVKNWLFTTEWDSVCLTGPEAGVRSSCQAGPPGPDGESVPTPPLALVACHLNCPLAGDASLQSQPSSYAASSLYASLFRCPAAWGPPCSSTTISTHDACNSPVSTRTHSEVQGWELPVQELSRTQLNPQ